MKYVIAFAGLLLAACQAEQVTSSGPTRLSTAADFAPILGKRLAFGDADFVVINADGTLAGNFAGTRTLGAWEIRDGFWCRTISTGPRGAQPEDCQLFVRNGNTLNITRERGAGGSFDYIIS